MAAPDEVTETLTSAEAWDALSAPGLAAELLRNRAADLGPVMVLDSPTA
jgi:hypothetical protein